MKVENENLQACLIVYRWIKQSSPSHNLGEINHIVIRKLHSRSIQAFVDKHNDIKSVDLDVMLKFLENRQRFNLLTSDLKSEKKKVPSVSTRTANVNAKDGSAASHGSRHNPGSYPTRQGHGWSQTCLFCNNNPRHMNHGTPKCPELLGISNMKHLKNILNTKRICCKCLRTAGENHSCEPSFTTRTGRVVNRPVCVHGLRKSVCPM